MKTSQILLPATIILSQHCNISSAKSLLRKRQDTDIDTAATEFERELGDTRIIGGDEANEDRFSYAVSLADRSFLWWFINCKGCYTHGSSLSRW